jgi:hypothetical protein
MVSHFGRANQSSGELSRGIPALFGRADGDDFAGCTHTRRRSSLETAGNQYDCRPSLDAGVLLVLGACVCRLLALSGPDSPEKVVRTEYSERFSENWQ